MTQASKKRSREKNTGEGRDWTGERQAAERELLSKQWDGGIDWGQYQLGISEATVDFALRAGIWHVAVLRRVVEQKAGLNGCDVNTMFLNCREDVAQIVSDLISNNTLDGDRCAAIAFLLLMVTCRDLDLPDGGRHHAMTLLFGLDFQANGDPDAPTDAELLRGVWKALWALDYAGLIDLKGWQPQKVVYKGTLYIGFEPCAALIAPASSLPN